MVRDPEVSGFLVQGSVARGDAYPVSDLDLYVLLGDGIRRPFQSTYREGILVEVKALDRHQALAQCTETPMGVYQFLDAVILLDHEGELGRLRDRARDLFERYRPPEAELQSLRYWLESALVKIQAAGRAQDDVKASFVVATTSWKIIEALWAVNQKPVPPNGAVLFHLKDLTVGPPDLVGAIHGMVAGDASRRIDQAVRLIRWLLPRLTGSA